MALAAERCRRPVRCLTPGQLLGLAAALPGRSTWGFYHQMMMQQRHHIKEEMSKQNNQSALQAQDINIILEVQKPADSSSQDLKLEKGLHHDPSSTAGLIK